MNAITLQGIFRTAIQVEQNAADYYAQVAELQPLHRSLLMRLSEMERSHGNQLSSMIESSVREQSDADGAAPDTGSDYLEAIISQSGEGSLSAEDLGEDAALSDILQTAIDAEKQAVLFYLGLKDVVRGEAGRQGINDILEQEMGHIAALYAVRKKAVGD